MSEIVSLIDNALMGSGKSFSRFCSILRASDFSTQIPIQFSDLSLTSTKEFRGRLLVFCACDNDIFQPEIDSRAVGNDNFRRFLDDTFSVDRNEPLPKMISSKACAFDRSLDRAALDHFQGSEFGNQHLAIFDFDILWNPKRLDRTMFLFEFRETGSFLEEPIECSIQVLNGLLRNLRWNIVQPFIIGTILHPGDLFLNLPGCDRFPGLLVGLFLSIKSIVVGEPRSTSQLLESFVLLLCEFKPKLECFLDLHFHTRERYGR